MDTQKMAAATENPWKARNELSRILAYPRIRLLFAYHGVSWKPQWRMYGAPIILRNRGSVMNFGHGLQLRSTARSNPLGPNRPVVLCTWTRGAELEAGRNFSMTGGTICAAERISIGDDVAVGANSTIIDTDFHPLDPGLRRLSPQTAATAPIEIGDDVFIGMNCIILKGVSVGSGAVIGAGSVVSASVDPGAIVAGNPCRPIGIVKKRGAN